MSNPLAKPLQGLFFHSRASQKFLHSSEKFSREWTRVFPRMNCSFVPRKLFHIQDLFCSDCRICFAEVLSFVLWALLYWNMWYSFIYLWYKKNRVNLTLSFLSPHRFRNPYSYTLGSIFWARTFRAWRRSAMSRYSLSEGCGPCVGTATAKSMLPMTCVESVGGKPVCRHLVLHFLPFFSLSFQKYLGQFCYCLAKK